MFVTAFAGCARRDEELLEETEFFYSEGLDENGFWQGVNASDFIEMFNYGALDIPNDVHSIPDFVIQSVINDVLMEFPTVGIVTDRAVELFDTVSIHFAGSVDGVAFEGGTGYWDLMIGSGSFIPGFEEQLIGAMPGDVVNVEVTFPDFYPQNTDLEGADAVFVTTIYHIVESAPAELTDEYVFENFFMFWGLATVEEFTEFLVSDMRNHAVRQYIEQYLINDVVISQMPEPLIRYQERAMISYFEEYADMYGMDLEDFLMLFVGVESLEELKEVNREGIIMQAAFSLVIQAVAEDAGISVNEDDMANYFFEHTGFADYSMFIDMYGLPYLKQIVLMEKVMDFIFDNVVLQ